MSQKSSLPQAAKSISQVLMSDTLEGAFDGRCEAAHKSAKVGSLDD
jgi:hypothetical protein